jgi:hypothetical protein
MGGEWFYTEQGQERGPVTFEQLQQIASTGQFQPTDMVWNDGMPQWVPAGSQMVLFEPACAPPRKPQGGIGAGLKVALFGGGTAVLLGGLCCGVIGVIVVANGAKGTNGKPAHDISQLEIAILNFQNAYKVGYLPSKIKLCEKYGDYDMTRQLDKDSVTYLTILWPHLLEKDPATGNIRWQASFLDWNGNGAADGAVTLEGDQCLVFFLGGIPRQGATPGCLGFSTDPRDPTKLRQTIGRRGPFFEFPFDRLTKRGVNGYYSYLDPFGKGKAYIYFSNYGVRNGYQKYGTSDCSLQPGGPYYVNPRTYHNPESYQILCAGADGNFGPGGFWTRKNAGAIAPNGRDDLSNFNQGNLMGVGD